ncbi:MAG: dihydrofolate reductase [Gammaproteobacteria bacterium]|nr:MAG: dihydrofolate reductase [Gammaproteobacteria bacterium]
MTRFIAIAAMGAEREIGGDGQMLWHNAAELQHFKDLTEGHTVVMGRKTFESLPKSGLPNRKNVVITSKKGSVSVEGDILLWHPDLLDLLKTTLSRGDEEIVWIIGGGQLYTSTLSWWDEVILTKMPDSYPLADTFFPEFEQDFILEKENEIDGLTYCYYRRK